MNLQTAVLQRKSNKAVFLVVALFLAVSLFAMSVYAQTISSPVSAITSTGATSSPSGTALQREQSQEATATVTLNTPVNVAAVNKSDFTVNLQGAPGGGWINGNTNPAMDFDVTVVNSTTLQFTIFATEFAEVPNGTPETADNDFFAMRTKLVTITAANSSGGSGTIPSITLSGTSTPLTWADNSFSNVVFSTGAAGNEQYVYAAQVYNDTNIPPSTQFKFTSPSAVRGMVSIKGYSTVGGVNTPIQFSANPLLDYAAPVHGHDFLTMTTSSYASLLAVTINNSAAPYSATASGDTVTITKTSGYVDGETLHFQLLTYANKN